MEFPVFNPKLEGYPLKMPDLNYWCAPWPYFHGQEVLSFIVHHESVPLLLFPIPKINVVRICCINHVYPQLMGFFAVSVLAPMFLCKG